MKPLILILAMLTALNASARKQAVITGFVMDEQGGGVATATVSLFRQADSTLAKAALTNSDGSFSILPPAPGTYYLIVTAAGFERQQSASITVKENEEVNLPQIRLVKTAKTLQGVTIQAKRPLVERKIDRTIINVEAALSNAGTNALELLEKSPGVTVDKDGNISMAGKQSVMVLIDGRPAYLSGQQLADMLKSMPSANLDQIEIMTNPPAKFDAAGNSGIINLRTKKARSGGLNGNVSSSFAYADVFRTNQSLNINYKTQKMNWFANYGYNLWQGKNTNHFIRNFRNAATDELETIFDQTNEGRHRYANHSFKLGTDFYPSSKTTIGAVISGYLNDGYSKGLNINSLNNARNETDSLVVANNYSDRRGNHIAGNWNLRHTFDSAGKEFSIDLDYLRYDQGSDQSLSTSYFNANGSVRRPSSTLLGELPSVIDIYSAKTDVTVPFRSGWKLETGLKSSYVTTDNDALYKMKVKDYYEIDYGKTNRFLYKENINAAYLNLSRQYKKWGLQAGLRAENTNMRGHQVGNAAHPDSVFNNSYFNLFPTAYVSYKANDKNTLSINYGRRINRPRYQELNPFMYFLDEYTYEVGNTMLKPEFTDNLELSHSYKGRITTTLDYSHTSHAFAEVLKQIDEERKTYQTMENLAETYTYGLAVSANVPVTSVWTTSLYAKAYYAHFEGPLSGKYLRRGDEAFLANANNQFKLKKGWGAELSGFYRSKTVDGQIVINPMWRIDAGVQKAVLKDKGSIKLSVRDLFNTQNFSGRIYYDNIDLSIDNKRINRTFSLTFSYRFGKPVNTGRQRKTGGAEEEKSRVSQQNG